VIKPVFVIEPDWPAPAWVKAYSTTRQGGYSGSPFAALNLAHHVEDDRAVVQQNREWLSQHLSLPAKPLWLQQVHGVNIISHQVKSAVIPMVDGSYSKRLNEVCVVLTADCLPVLLCDQTGTSVAAVHAGWRGLAQGVIESAVQQLGIVGSELMAWLGPAIGAQAFEVGEAVRANFVAQDKSMGNYFVGIGGKKYKADLYGLARFRLQRLGVSAVFGGDRCTFSENADFFSYRRDGITGRQASLIWLSER